jgi:tetratricopeptide (TPR) repeat protein
VLETISMAGTLPDAGSDAPPAPARIGRFLVVSTLGAGGMGVVLSAYDPTLDRKVAIKILRGDRYSDAASLGRSRLVAEAQAMARLAHPNVVAVHEVAFVDGAAFLVMEHIAGPTLRGWLEAGTRAWPEVLAMFLGAGEGLAAAHREGLVHRDFKPENVLVDRDGRARVVDFGLAASEGTQGAGSTEIAGTLAYMAPEQLRGEQCDPRADQFAFSVALWEALHGNRPFAGATGAELLAAIQAGEVREPVRKAPERLRAALLRGLSHDPAARWPSLDELLRVLRRDPRRTRRWIAAGAAALGLAAGVVWAAWPSVAAVDPCGGAAARLAGAWDPAREARLHAAFAASKLPYADSTWRGVRDELERYAGSWRAMAVETCRATRVDGRQSDTLMDLRMACLEQRRSLLGALTDVWARGVDADAVEHAGNAAAGLAPLAECADARALTERAPIPPGSAARVAAARANLNAALALTLAHRWAEARPRAALVRAEADATGWAQLRAEAAFAEGDVLSYLNDPAAEPALLASQRFAGEAHDDRLAARALVRLAGELAVDQQNASRALLVADVAEGLVARTGDAGLRAQLLRVRGNALVTAGKTAEAKQALEAARALAIPALGADDPTTLAVMSSLAILLRAQGDFAGARALGEATLAASIKRLGPDHPQLAVILNELGGNMSESGDSDAAIGYLQRALAISERAAGPDSAPVALALSNLGAAQRVSGKLDDALASLERSLAIRERVLGKDHPLLVSTLSNLGEVRRMQGKFAEALALQKRALAVATQAYGPMHAKTALVLHKLGGVLTEMGEPAQALEYFQRSLEVRRKVLGDDHAMTHYSRVLISDALAALHRCKEAEPLLTVAEAGLTKAFGPDHSDVRRALTVEAQCDLEAGRPDAAIRRLSHVVEIDERKRVLSPITGEHRWHLSRALWAAGRRDEAIAAARKAAGELANDRESEMYLADVTKWLAANAR